MSGTLLSDLSTDLTRIREHATDLGWWRRKLRYRTAAKLSQLLYDQGGIDYVDADWDNMIVLDACRADLFEEVLDVNRFDQYRTVHSNASLTAEWVKQNFRNRQLDDTVYVSASPHLSIHAGDAFYDLVEVWKDAFDPDHHTVLPEAVTHAALDAYTDDKRLVVHYLQPHQPYYMSDLWDEMKAELNGDAQYDGTNPLRELAPRPWTALKDGRYSEEEFRNAYKQTLRAVFDEVQRLTDRLDGRTVITADHGELFGEPVHPHVPEPLYGHPTRGLRLPALTEVPWAVIEDDRRHITAGSITARDRPDADVVEDRLADLGYR